MGSCRHGHVIASDAYPLTVHILAIFAHADDLELWAGGTTLLHVDAGDRITSFVFYELNATRAAELKHAWNGTALDIRLAATEAYSPIAHSATSDLLDDVPDIVLTHWNRDVHIEHRLAFEHAVLFCHEAKRHRKRTPILLMTTSYYAAGYAHVFRPSIIVDISATMPRKQRAIAEHLSQHPEQLLADVEAQNRLLGARIGVEYAEGFDEYPLFGFHRSAARASLAELIGRTPPAR